MMERPWWQRVIYQIWPRIYKLINGIIFFILMIIRSAVREAIRQIRRL